jgi:hypothetical protein
MSNTLFQGKRNAQHVISEGNGQISRETVTFAPTTVPILSGTTVGKVTATGKWKPYVNTATDGSEVARAALWLHLPASTVDAKAVVHLRLCEFDRQHLLGLDVPGEADLNVANIFVR